MGAGYGGVSDFSSASPFYYYNMWDLGLGLRVQYDVMLLLFKVSGFLFKDFVFLLDYIFDLDY